MFGRKGRNEQHHTYEPMKDILDTLNKCLTTPTEIREERIICTDWNISISPEIENLDDRSAVLNFYLNCPDWDEPLFECCASVAGDPKTAVGTALSSFMFAFMDGIGCMMTNNNSVPIESEFNGVKHSWKLYRSNIVGLGESVDPDYESYWNALKDEIIKRLGNQRMTYVKVYGAKAIGADGSCNITGECRVNDVPSEELGAIVHDIAAKWDIKQFTSQKLFFFIRQDSSTLLPYPYRMNKIPELREKVKKALEVLNRCDNEEQYNRLVPDITEAIGDYTLAEECFGFLPEICAERAFNQIQYSEQITFAPEGKESLTLYKNQLADYYPLGNLMFGIFDSGYFGDQTNDLYKKLIAISAIYGSVSKMLDNGSKLEDVRLTALIYNVSEKFEIR